jgi:hypothetical protein
MYQNEIKAYLFEIILILLDKIKFKNEKLAYVEITIHIIISVNELKPLISILFLLKIVV